MSDGPRGFGPYLPVQSTAGLLSPKDRAAMSNQSMMPVRTTPVYAPPKKSGQRVGRNSPCPCKSGKKFKHCCKVQPS